MSYCPKCHHEYADTVELCIDCGGRLRKGRRPSEAYDLELEDFVIPAGSLLCGLIALSMLWLRVAAQAGWITGPFAQLLEAGQPPCMTAFYAVAVVACIIVFAWWVIQTFVLRRR